MKQTLFLCLSLLTVFSGINLVCAQTWEQDMTIINFGYAKYTFSPYSGAIVVTPFDSETGMERFQQSKFKKAFFKLAPHYAPQQHITTCGIASSVMVLNTIYAGNKLTPPVSVSGSWVAPEYKEVYANFVWTEENFFNSKIAGILSRDVVEGKTKVDGDYDVGVGLDKLAKVLSLQGLQSKAYHIDQVSNSGLDQFRSIIKQITANPDTFMIANYNLQIQSEIDGGHFSPIGAYDEISDSVLVIDTWSAFAPWVWINLYDLYHSLHTLDAKTYRGYILVDTKIAENPARAVTSPLTGSGTDTVFFKH